MPENAQETAEALNTVDQKIPKEVKMLIGSIIMFVLSCFWLAHSVYDAGGITPAIENAKRYFTLETVHVTYDNKAEEGSAASMDH